MSGDSSSLVRKPVNSLNTETRDFESRFRDSGANLGTKIRESEIFRNFSAKRVKLDNFESDYKLMLIFPRKIRFETFDDASISYDIWITIIIRFRIFETNPRSGEKISFVSRNRDSAYIIPTTYK